VKTALKKIDEGGIVVRGSKSIYLCSSGCIVWR
jgi:hypothetical protein